MRNGFFLGDLTHSSSFTYSYIHIFSDDGISIPCEYTSYLAPLHSSKLYNEVRASKDKDKPTDVSYVWELKCDEMYNGCFETTDLLFS